MNKILKHWWKIALILIAAGIAILVLGFSLGAHGGYAYFSEGKLRFASSGTYYRIEETNLEPFDTVEVRTRATSIELIESDHYGFEMQLPEQANTPEWSIAAGKLTIDISQMGSILTFMDFGIFRENYVKVYYPAGDAMSNMENYSNILESVSLTAYSGNITVRGISVDRVEINATSGNIRVDTPYYRSAVVHASSGNITFNGTGDDASLKLSAYSGFIRADVSGCSALDIDAKSGNVTISGNSNATAVMMVNANSGKIGINVTAWESLSAESSSGNIEIAGHPHGTTSVNARSGNVTMRLGGNEGDFAYDVSSGSGWIRIGGNRIGSPARNTNNAAENMLNVRTSSGNVRIDFS